MRTRAPRFENATYPRGTGQLVHVIQSTHHSKDSKISSSPLQWALTSWPQLTHLSTPQVDQNPNTTIFPKENNVIILVDSCSKRKGYFEIFGYRGSLREYSQPLVQRFGLKDFLFWFKQCQNHLDVMITEFTTHFIQILEHCSKQQQTSIPIVLPRPFTLFHRKPKKWEGCSTRVFEGSLRGCDSCARGFCQAETCYYT